MSRKTEKFIFMIILILQTAVICCRVFQKQNYYIDELLSMEYAKSFAYVDRPLQSTGMRDPVYFEYEKWIDNDVLKDTLIVYSEDGLLNLNIPAAAFKLITAPYNYFGLLNIVMSVFSPEELSHYPAAALNIIFFIFVQIILYRVLREITGGGIVSLLGVLMYGFSGMAVGLSVFVRFYAYAGFLFFLTIRLHQIMWRKETGLLKCEILTLISFACIIIAMRNSQLILILAGAMIFAYAAGQMFRGQYAKTVCYLGTCVPAGLFYVIRQTNLLDISLHPSRYTDAGGVEGRLTTRLLTIDSSRFASFYKQHAGYLSDYLFGSFYVLCGFLFLLAVLTVLRLRTQKQDPEKSAAGEEFRFVILTVDCVFILFSFLTGLAESRYVSFLYPLHTVLLWTVLARLLRNRSYRKAVLLLSTGLTCAGIFISAVLHPEKIQYLYITEKPVIEAVRESGITNVILYDSAIQAHYECVSLMPQTAEIFSVIDEDPHFDTSEFPDTLLLWSRRSRNNNAMIRKLKKDGYEVTKIGATHVSNIYTVRHQP